MNDGHVYTASSIGYVAWRTCIQSPTATVVGVTARGLFVRAAPDRVVFLSAENRCGPLTITLDRSFDRFRAVTPGATAQFADSRLIFPSIEAAISLSPDVIWRAPSPADRPHSPEKARSLLRSISALLEPRRVDGFGKLLPSLLDGVSPLAEQAALLDRLLAIRRAVQARDHPAMLAGLTALLGQGRGLTPSGDDMVIGLLLMLNRWRTECDWTVVNRAVIETAYRATTTISANLIECAADGQGDERLITVVDGIATGSASIEECVECVLDWGQTSGIDALVGMALAIIVHSRHGPANARFAVDEAPREEAYRHALIEQQIDVTAEALGMHDAVGEHLNVHQLSIIPSREDGALDSRWTTMAD